LYWAPTNAKPADTDEIHVWTFQNDKDWSGWTIESEWTQGTNQSDSDILCTVITTAGHPLPFCQPPKAKVLGKGFKH